MWPEEENVSANEENNEDVHAEEENVHADKENVGDVVVEKDTNPVEDDHLRRSSRRRKAPSYLREYQS